ncbi:MAG: RNA polymerase factor sigma-32 [Rhodospirillales bacterium]|nr:RNA polymerase factor sigma-32 [Rhodospirillales bacterium]
MNSSARSSNFAIAARRTTSPARRAKAAEEALRSDGVPHLNAQTEAHLIARWHAQKDEKALDQLVRSFQGLVHRVARQYLRSGLPLADLVSEGNVGLIQAINRFDPSRGFRLSTYATWWIRAGITEFVINASSMVRGVTTESHKRLFFNLQRLKRKHGAHEGCELTPSGITAIADELGVSEADVIRIDQWFGRKELSLDTPLRTGDGPGPSWQNILADPALDQEASMIRSDELDKRKSLVREALACLNERERHIVVQRHLIEEPQKLAEVGGALGISRERVRQIEMRALNKLRKRVMRSIRDLQADVDVQAA